MELITLTNDQINVNPSIVDGLELVCKDDQAGTRTYRKPAEAVTPAEEPKPKGKKK